MLENKLRQIFGDKLKKISDVADVVCGPFGSAIKNTDYRESGIPLIRITNISKDGYMNYDDLIFISEELGNSLSRTQVSSGDIVVSQRGSLGQCAIVDDAFPKINISANIIAIKNLRGVSATFLHDFFLSTIGQTLLERSVSGQVQQKITTQDIADLVIPIDTNEESLTSLINKAHESYKSKLRQADELLVDFETEISQKFNFDTLTENKLCIAIRLKDCDGVIDAKRYMGGKRKSDLTLGDVCDIVEEKENVANYQNEVIDWIRIDDLPNNPLEIETVRTLSANEMDGTFFKVQEGDILVARLGPTILNKKTVMVRKTERNTLASAEFLVLRCKKGFNAESVMAVLKTEYYKNLMYSNSRGSTPSRYRLNREDALKLPFPDISALQEDIAYKAVEISKKSRQLRLEAEQEWAAAKAQFEKELLGE